MPIDLERKRSLQARSLQSLLLQMNDQYEAALASDSVPDKARWMDYCQEQWAAKSH